MLGRFPGPGVFLFSVLFILVGSPTAQSTHPPEREAKNLLVTRNANAYHQNGLSRVVLKLHQGDVVAARRVVQDAQKGLVFVWPPLPPPRLAGSPSP